MEPNIFLVLLAALYLGACFVVSNVAAWRGHSSSAWFFAALFFTPLFAVIAVCGLPAQEAQNHSAA